MSTKRIILISGYARSGKDTLANALIKDLGAQGYNAEVTKFAYTLKRALNLALADVGLDVDDDNDGFIDVFTEDPVEKSLIRPLFVEFGKYCRAKDKDVFVKKTLDEVDECLHHKSDVVLISDCRYLNEAKLVREYGKELGYTVVRVHISRDGNTPANDEEEQSIQELMAFDPLTETLQCHFSDGPNGVENIGLWAKKLVGSLSKPIITVSGTERFGAEEIEKRNAQRVKDMKDMNAVLEAAPGMGVPVNPGKVAAYLPQPMFTKPWEDEIRALDETIDQVSKRVDAHDERITKIRDYSVGRTDRLMDKIRELEARIEKLEVAR